MAGAGPGGDGWNREGGRRAAVGTAMTRPIERGLQPHGLQPDRKKRHIGAAQREQCGIEQSEADSESGCLKTMGTVFGASDINSIAIR